MPMVELDYNDLEILIREYNKQHEKLDGEIHKLNFINRSINKLNSEVGKDILKDKEYVSQYNVLADLREADAELEEIKHKEGYFMRTVRESMCGTNSSDQSIEGE